jgi:valyl-tRNA synthetase
MVSAWPTAGPRDSGAEANIGDLVELIRGVRNLKAERGVEPGRFLRATVVGGARTALLREQAPIVAGLARLEPLEVVESLTERPKQALPLVAGGFEAYIPAADLFDVDKERTRLGAEIARAEQLIAHSEGLLARPGFVERAKAEVVQAERDKLAANRDQRERLRAQLAALGDA